LRIAFLVGVAVSRRRQEAGTAETTFCTARSLFGLKIARDSIDAVPEETTGGTS
jgi:hypothetical protein